MTSDPLVALEATVLSAVLLGRPLPGLERGIELADVQLAIDADGIVRLLDEGYAMRVAQLVVPVIESNRSDVRGIKLMSAGSLRSTHGLLGALRIGAEEGVGSVRVTVQTCLPSPDDVIIPIESLILTFVDRHGTWILAEPPRHLAT